MTEQKQIQRLTAEVAELRSKLFAEKRRTGSLMVDADRREAKARLIAESCEEHGKEIQYLRHTASWYWEEMNRAEQTRQAMITHLMLAVRAFEGRTDSVPVADVTRWLNKAIKAHDKATRGPVKYPALADCQRNGGCDHEGLSPELSAEIMTALGLGQRKPADG